MDLINGLSDDLLIKILLFVPTKVAVSTSILSKRWEFLWMWVPKLEHGEYDDLYDSNHSESSSLSNRDFIKKNLPLHRAPIIESLRLRFHFSSVRPVDIKVWVGIAVSRCMRELSINYSCFSDEPNPHVLPSSLYTCKSLVTLKLRGEDILVDVPPTVCLPCLKTLQLGRATYTNDDSLRLLLSNCPVLEDLDIELHDNVKGLAVIVPSLQRLSLKIYHRCSSDDDYVIATPSLKYFKVEDWRHEISYLIKAMPKLEEADIVDDFLVSIKYVKRLTLKVQPNLEEPMYPAGIVFARLEHLNLTIDDDNWSKLVVRLLSDSPNLRVLSLYVGGYFSKYEEINWSSELSSVPTCLFESLETFEFKGYKGRPEVRDFLSFISKNARCLKSTSILPSTFT